MFDTTTSDMVGEIYGGCSGRIWEGTGKNAKRDGPEVGEIFEYGKVGWLDDDGSSSDIITSGYVETGGGESVRRSTEALATGVSRALRSAARKQR